MLIALLVSYSDPYISYIFILGVCVCQFSRASVAKKATSLSDDVLISCSLGANYA